MSKKNSEKLPVMSAWRYQCDGPDGCLSRTPFPAGHKCRSELELAQQRKACERGK